MAAFGLTVSCELTQNLGALYGLCIILGNNNDDYVKYIHNLAMKRGFASTGDTY